MRVVILGAGLSGLARALREARAGHDVTVVEREQPGGLAASHVLEGFLFDRGPHILRSSDPDLLAFAKSIMGAHRAVRSRPGIFKYGIYFDSVIPVLPRANIDALPAALRERAYAELEALERAGEGSRPAADNFADAIAAKVGSTLGQEFFFDYSAKAWGVPAHRMAVDLAPPRLRIGEQASYGHLTTDFANSREELYPEEGGIQALADGLAREAQRAGARLVTESEVTELVTRAGAIREVVSRRGGGLVRHASDRVVSTIPIVDLATLLSLPCALRFRAVLCVFIKLRAGAPALEHSWVYLHDPGAIASRLHQPTYYSPRNAPDGWMSLCAEVHCDAGDERWNDPDLPAKVVADLEQLGFLRAADSPEVLGVSRLPHAYPIYERGYREALGAVNERLALYRNLETIGRSGTFSYINMDGCLAGMGNARSRHVDAKAVGG